MFSHRTKNKKARKKHKEQNIILKIIQKMKKNKF